MGLPKKIAGLLLVVVLLATALAYAPSLGFGFVDDDHGFIVENPRLRDWHEVPGYFTSSLWAHLTPVAGDIPPPFYRPMFLVWFFVNYQLFGTDPAGWHLTSILLHLLATLLAYRVVRAVTGDGMAGVIAALLFGLHPIHVETVAWVTGVPEVLMANAFFASMLCYLKGRERQGLAWPAASLFFYGLALLAKETAIMLPAVLVTYEMTVGGNRRPRWQRFAPYIALALIYFVIRSVVLGGTFTAAVSWPVTFLTWPPVLWYYFRRLLWPVNLSLICDLDYVRSLSWRTLILPYAIISASALAVWFATRQRPLLRFAALWTVLLILPPLYLRGIAGGGIAHDRYLYLSSLGLCMLIAIGIVRLKWWPAAAILGVLAMLGVYRESKPWANDVALYQRGLQLSPASEPAHRQLGLALASAGRCDEAMPLLEQVRQQHEDPRILLGLAGCLCRQRQFQEAEPLIQRAISIAPRYQLPYVLLIGSRLAQNRLDEAEAIWRRALLVRVGPTDVHDLHLLGGQILKARGDLSGAANEFRRELAIDPSSEGAARELDEIEWTQRKASGAGR